MNGYHFKSKYENEVDSIIHAHRIEKKAKVLNEIQVEIMMKTIELTMLQTRYIMIRAQPIKPKYKEGGLIIPNNIRNKLL